MTDLTALIALQSALDLIDRANAAPLSRRYALLLPAEGLIARVERAGLCPDRCAHTRAVLRSAMTGTPRTWVSRQKEAA